MGVCVVPEIRILSAKRLLEGILVSGGGALNIEQSVSVRKVESVH